MNARLGIMAKFYLLSSEIAFIIKLERTSGSEKAAVRLDRRAIVERRVVACDAYVSKSMLVGDSSDENEAPHRGIGN